ncbi:MAG TPA: hypothetical protein ENG90_02185 [Gammaproteobacteria bacterium]|nr:putative agmatine deiminase [bacterium BMS3Abin11]GMT39358.1 MAG: hypothetical protein IEMM0001_0093 [bacterium]HDH15279.1 hypothetical protein [Gammaproteobacteria bacterium]
MKPYKSRLPAEWEHQSGILISWPTNSTDWCDNLADAEATYVELTKLIAQNCHAYICCDNSDTRQHVQQCCNKAGIPSERFELFTIPYDDTWTRDYGPISLVRENDVVWLNFKFNAWGNKHPHQQDNLLTSLLHQQFSPKRVLETINFVLEGGSIECDGDNTVITTSLCLLDPARNSGLYHNTAIVLDSDGSLADCYRKMHIPDDPGYYEKYYFAPGDTGFKPIRTSLGNIGVLLCWDQWFPEAARLMALAGAELLVYPTAIGWDPADNETEQQNQLDSWITVQSGHAITNGIPLLTANRHGLEIDPSGNTKGINFWGNSFICGPQGEILSQAGASKDCLLQTEINLNYCERIRQTWPFLRDRRTDAYAGLSQQFLDD